VKQSLLSVETELELWKTNNGLKFVSEKFESFAGYKVESIVDIPVLRLWWRNLGLRWSLPIVGLEEDYQQ
jgi:hypothetical protein